MHVPGQRGGAAIAPDLGGGQGIGLIIGAEAAMLFRNGDGEQAGAMQIPVILDREFRVAVVGRGAVREHRLAEFASARDDASLFVIEPECLRVEDRSVQIDGIDAFAGLYRHPTVTSVAAIWA